MKKMGLPKVGMITFSDAREHEYKVLLTWTTVNSYLAAGWATKNKQAERAGVVNAPCSATTARSAGSFSACGAGS